MNRVYVICEGHTELQFIKQILKPELIEHGVDLRPSLVGEKTGGDVSWRRVFSDVRIRLQDKQAYCTTLIDFYGLANDFPGLEDAKSKIEPSEKLACLKNAIAKKIEEQIDFNARTRFLPYCQMHEFEGLLFSDLQALCESWNELARLPKYQKVLNEFGDPEKINDSPTSAPSKRIKKIFPRFSKPVYPLLAARKIGLKKMREECKLFDTWITDMLELNGPG